MGLFDIFKKKECCICGNEVGLIGNRKLSDGNMCSKCAKRLSPWFTDRRESTMEEIRQQLAYREENARRLESFRITRTYGDYYKVYVEEAEGVPSRFFVTCDSDHTKANPDIISFKDVASCVTDIKESETEMKQKDSEGNLVSYNPPRYKHNYDFFIEMEIRNNPYFDSIRFQINNSTVTIETAGGVSGFGGAVLRGALKGSIGESLDAPIHSFSNSRAQERYQEYARTCDKILQTVEDGKRGAASGAQPAAIDPKAALIEQIRNAPDLASAAALQQTLVMLIMNDPNKAALMDQATTAMAEATVRIETQMAMAAASAPAPAPAGPKFCPNCGAPQEGGKFCGSCGSKLM